MHDKIKYYIENEKKLKKIQEKSVELAKKYAHEGVSKMLMNEIVRRSRQDK
jgi:spore maturation protein CgeB